MGCSPPPSRPKGRRGLRGRPTFSSFVVARGPCGAPLRSRLCAGHSPDEQLSADQIEGELAGLPAHALAVADELALFDVAALRIGERDVDETGGLGSGATAASVLGGSRGPG